MDRRFVARASLVVTALLVPIGALAFGAWDELPRFIDAPSPTNSPDAVVLNIDPDFAESSQRLEVFNQAHENVQNEITQKVDKIAARGRATYGLDSACLDTMLDGVRGLQNELDQIHREYYALVNSQGGVISSEQDLEFRKRCMIVHKEIQLKIHQANVFASGSNFYRCA